MQSIGVNFKSSGKLMMVFVSAGLFALSVLLYLYYTVAIQNFAIILPLCLLIVFATSYAVCDQALMLWPWSIVGFMIKADCLHLVRRDNAKYAAIVLPTTTVNVYLTVLNLQRIDSATDTAVKKRFLARCGAYLQQVFFYKLNIIVMQDKFVDGDDFRRLRVWLRFSAIGDR